MASRRPDIDVINRVLYGSPTKVEADEVRRWLAETDPEYADVVEEYEAEKAKRGDSEVEPERDHSMAGLFDPVAAVLHASIDIILSPLVLFFGLLATLSQAAADAFSPGMPGYARGWRFRPVEVLSCMAIAATMFGLLLPYLNTSRAAARRAQCVNNLKQIGLAMHNYESGNGCFPQGMRGCCWGTWLIPILPFAEEQALFNSWNASGNNDPALTASYGAERMFRYAGEANITVTSRRVVAYFCPSDGNNERTVGVGALGRRVTSQNYVVNFGNTTMQQGEFMHNGVTYSFLGAPFSDVGAPLPSIKPEGGGGHARIASIIDGLSNTMMTSEVLVGVSGANWDLRGFSHWAYASNFVGQLTPNTSIPDRMQGSGYCNYPFARNPPCVGGENGQVMIAARSNHDGGVNVGFCDGSVKFVKNSVSPPTYQAISSTRGREVVSPDAY